MNPNAVARASITSGQTKMVTSSATATRTDTTSAMLRILKRSVRNGRRTMTKTFTSPSAGELIYEFFIFPTLRIEKRPDRLVMELCWFNKYFGIIKNYWEEDNE
jgi:hypothetical protein